jgi:hypothetical protein
MVDREPAEGHTTPDIERHVEFSTDEILQYAEDLAVGLARYALETRGMLEEAKARGITVDVSETAIADFTPQREGELTLLRLRGKLMDAQSAIASQGVLMTREDMDRRLAMMPPSDRDRPMR